jgi:phosphoribosyl-ATP pyrophosphohydrolase
MAELSTTSSLFPRETEHPSHVPRETGTSSIPYGEERPSSVLTTFYSFKGGVGRTQSLYNVAARLTALRRKVLMVDVDLEAPGLSITLDEERRRSKEGFAEIGAALLKDLETAFDEQEDLEYLQALKARYTARIQRALHELEPPMSPKNEDLEERLQREMDVQIPAEGSLSLLSVGRVGTDYTQQVAQLPLAEAYDDGLDPVNQAVVKSLVENFQTPVDRDRLRTRGHAFAAIFRELLRSATVPNRRDETFDHVLIDSRSGLADVGGLCLLGLAETRVVLTGLNEQNVTGTKMVLDDIAEVDDDARKPSHLITVFSPVPEGEVDLLAKRLESAKDTLGVSDDQVRLLHYHPRIALEEKPFAEPAHEYTRIYDEYEDLTDHLLALTRSDARSLVSDALERFREDDEDDSNAEEKEGARYLKLASELLPAAFLDEDHVESTLDGLCTQTKRSGPYKSDATALFDLWVALAPDEFRVLGTTADFYSAVIREASSENAESILRRRLELDERISNKISDDAQPWYNWGTNLSHLAQLVQGNDPDRAESLYREAFEKFQEAVDIKPDMQEAWYNWGSNLGRLAHLLQGDDRDRADSLYRKAFGKYQKATDIKPEDHEAWCNWGVDLIRLSRLLISQDQKEEAQNALSAAVDKLHEALSYEIHELNFFWVVVALAERDEKDDVETAADHLTSLLEETPGYVVKFYTEDAEAVRSHSELREILDEYREQVDEDELDEAESPEELDAPDLSE